MLPGPVADKPRKRKRKEDPTMPTMGGTERQRRKRSCLAKRKPALKRHTPEPNTTIAATSGTLSVRV